MKPLNRLLIANRGEIVVRIARSARQMGILTIAVHSDVDRDAPHTRACDEAVSIGGSAPADSYLRVDRILDAAVRCGAQGIHPGYGFLSENASFAAAVEAAGMIYVGPTAAAVHAMADKARARRRMAAAGIPVIPGYDDDAQDHERLRAAAESIGFPLMVKAAAGGGGRGMRLVSASAELPEALRSAASEALKSFGDARLILERALVDPRHVEIQVMADSHGNVIHLGERDCSVQRRHQKVIEEMPSPAVDPRLRERMGATAIGVAREIGYRGAGTVEFLLDAAGDFFFMEMNTRLQVEHPVTELVTGIDLVELQLRVARGEHLPVGQADVRLQGHAIEARLCAEEPADDFMPRSGVIADWSIGERVRCDHAITTGMSVTPWYDSMLAKVIAHGSNREEAIDRLAQALERTSLLGVASNRGFLIRVLRHPAFASGSQVSTAFIGRYFAAATARASAPDARLWALAGWLSVAASKEAMQTPAPWRLWSNAPSLPCPWRLEWLAPQSLSTGQPSVQGGELRLRADSAQLGSAAGWHAIDGEAAAPNRWAQVGIDGARLSYRYAWQGEVLWLHTAAGDHVFRCRRREAVRARGAEAASGEQIKASINGRVIEIAVAIGAAVSAGQRLLVVEAMKMEHEVRAARAGRVTAIGVKSGEQVAPGQWLVSLQGES